MGKIQITSGFMLLLFAQKTRKNPIDFKLWSEELNIIRRLIVVTNAFSKMHLIGCNKVHYLNFLREYLFVR
jgi:hypothetical protein